MKSVKKPFIFCLLSLLLMIAVQAHAELGPNIVVNHSLKICGLYWPGEDNRGNYELAKGWSDDNRTCESLGFPLLTNAETKTLKPVYIFLFWELIVLSLVIFIGISYFIFKKYRHCSPNIKKYLTIILILLISALTIGFASFYAYKTFIDPSFTIYSWAYHRLAGG